VPGLLYSLFAAMALSDKKRRMYKKKRRVYKKGEEGVQRREGCTKIGLLQAKTAGILNFINKLVDIILNRSYYVT
jgi:hypothetical protein